MFSKKMLAYTAIEPTPVQFHGDHSRVKPPKPRVEERETAIDILYENERGGFLCGVGLFSGAALGSLDPAPWSESNINARDKGCKQY